jgi:two-component system alkaline phosphatase synthesis response regulator PhoP
MSTILVVDDDDAILRAIEQVILSLGHNCILASNALEGIAAAESTALALALVDMHMPGLDGLEVLKSLGRLSPRVPVIGMSGGSPLTSAEAYEVLALRLGAEKFLSKPFSVSQLSSAITGVLARDSGA